MSENFSLLSAEYNSPPVKTTRDRSFAFSFHCQAASIYSPRLHFACVIVASGTEYIIINLSFSDRSVLINLKSL